MFAQKYLSLGGFSDQWTLGDTIDWNSIIRQAIATGDHAISAFSGAHTGTQVGVNAQGGIFSITPSYDEATLYNRGLNPVTGYPYASTQYPAQQGVAEDALGSIGNFVSQHPLMVFGGIAALLLLMREPPRSRR